MLALLLLAAQLRAATTGVPPRQVAAVAEDSAREQSRARRAQAAFERSRRSLLPLGSSGGGRCDVQLGRYCWWYDDHQPILPPESATLTKRRAELLAELDALGARYPGPPSTWRGTIIGNPRAANAARAAAADDSATKSLRVTFLRAM